MLKNYFATILLLIICAAPLVGAQDVVQDKEPLSVTMGPSWKVGDKIVLTRVKEKFVVQQGKAVPTTRAQSTVKVEVLEKNEKGSVISWTTIGTKVQMADQGELNKIVKKLGEITPSVKVVFLTDERGRPLKVRNVKAVNKIYADLSTKIQVWMKDNGISDQMQQAITAQLGNYANPATVDLVALRDPTLYFVRFETLKAGQPKDEKFDVPMDKNREKNLPAISRTNLAKIEGGLAYIEYKQVLDQKKVGPILLDIMQQQAIANGQPLPTLSQVPHFDLQSEIKLRLNLKTGFPEDLTNVQTKVSGPQGSIDRSFFFRKPKEMATSKPTSQPAKK